MKMKYCSNSHPVFAVSKPHHSKFWKALISVRDCAEENIHWIVREGDIDFWNDSWLPEGKLAYLDPQQAATGSKVRDFWEDEGWKWGPILQVVPTEVRASIELSQIDYSRPDSIRWKASSNGLFSTKETWDLIRDRSESDRVFNLIWSSNFPKKVSFLVWRLMHSWIPVDEINKRRGMAIVSKCQCCEAVETITHVFFHSSIAQSIWHHFHQLFGVYHKICDNPRMALVH